MHLQPPPQQPIQQLAITYNVIKTCAHLNLTDFMLVCGVAGTMPGMLRFDCMLIAGEKCLPDPTRFLIAARAPITDTSCFNANMPAAISAKQQSAAYIRCSNDICLVTRHCKESR
jgi:hypothetical protein